MRKAIILAACLAAGAAGAFDASPLLQFITAQSFTPLTLGPVAWWKMDDNADSKVVVDSAGGNTGTSVTNTSIMATAGINGGALAFNGSSDSVNVGNVPGYFTTNTTLAFWVYINNIGDNYWSFMDKFAGAGDNRQPALQFQSGNLRFWYYSGGSSYITMTSGLGLTTNTWYHVAVTTVANVPSNQVSIYVNGVSKLSEDKGAIPSSTSTILTLGGVRDGRLNGLLDDVLVFPRALTQSEITQLYNWRQ
jgi:hypothetical protein